jgi:hypothetical protein
MNRLHHLNQDNLPSINKEYKERTYDELSSDFQEIQPSMVRAFELIGLMYNRLTIVDKFSHKEAVAKIQNDHKHLPGFSERNIRRYLPLDNLSVPRRVRSQCPKNSVVETNEPSKLSDTIEEEKHLKLPLTNDSTEAKTANLASKLSGQSVECSGCISLSLENRELKEALEKSSKLITADNMAHPAAPPINEIYNVLEFEFTLSKKEILDSWGELYLEIADAEKQVWFSGKIDAKNRRVISAKIGRSQQQVDCNNIGDTQ